MTKATAKSKRTATKTKTEEQIAPRKPLAFVIMPFVLAKPLLGKQSKYPPRGKEELTRLYGLLEKFLAREGYEVKRSDTSGNILQTIVHDIHRASLVVAVVTGLNSNVMYELGIAHGLRKKTILLTEDLRELPFDLSGYNCEEYQYGGTERSKALGRLVSRAVRKIVSEQGATHGPVETHLDVSQYAVLLADRRVASRRMAVLINEIEVIRYANAMILSAVLASNPEIIKTFNGTAQTSVADAEKVALGKTLPVDALDPVIRAHPALNLFLCENYVPEGILSEEEDTGLFDMLWALRTDIVGTPLSLLRMLNISYACVRIDDDLGEVANRLIGIPATQELRSSGDPVPVHMTSFVIEQDVLEMMKEHPSPELRVMLERSKSTAKQTSQN